MPGYTIHLAIASEYMKHNKVEDEADFIRGVIIPDLLKTSTSHFGIKENKLDFDELKRCIDINSSYGRGYYLHLITDYLFYYKFISSMALDRYSDYDILNPFLIAKYSLKIPAEIKDLIKFKEGVPKILTESSTSDFIERTSKINLEEYFALGSNLS